MTRLEVKVSFYTVVITRFRHDEDVTTDIVTFVDRDDAIQYATEHAHDVFYMDEIKTGDIDVYGPHDLGVNLLGALRIFTTREDD